jgi:hypothetical protein
MAFSLYHVDCGLHLPQNYILNTTAQVSVRNCAIGKSKLKHTEIFYCTSTLLTFYINFALSSLRYVYINVVAIGRNFVEKENYCFTRQFLNFAPPPGPSVKKIKKFETFRQQGLLPSADRTIGEAPTQLARYSYSQTLGPL